MKKVLLIIFQSYLQFFSNKEFIYGMFANGHINDINFQIFFLLFCFIICIFFPNTYQLFPNAFLPKEKLFQNNKGIKFVWHQSKSWAFIISFLLVLNIIFLGREQSFLYFQF